MRILITGAAGFISSGLIGYLNENHPDLEIIVVDKFNIEKKTCNLEGKKIFQFIERDKLFTGDKMLFLEWNL